MSTAIRYLAPDAKRKIMAGEEPAWLTKHPRASYVRSGYLSVPPWVDREEMKWIHLCKCAWSKVRGIEFVLDHIVPLNHPNVCGLTVPWNLRLVPRAINAFKGSKWNENQFEMNLEEALV